MSPAGNARPAGREPDGCVKMLRRFEQSMAREGDIELLYDVAKNIEGRTICALGEAAAWPVYFTIERFRDEFEARVKPGLELHSPERVHGLRRGGLEPVQVRMPVVVRT